MGHKNINVHVSPDLVATSPDTLNSDILSIECNQRVVIAPGRQTRVNLTVRNTSLLGRMARLQANYDSRCFSVIIPTPDIYVGPDGKTVVYAIITPIMEGGQSTVTFDVA